MADKKQDVNEVISERVFWIKQWKTGALAVIALMAVIVGSCTYQSVNTNAANIQIEREKSLKSQHEAEKAMWDRFTSQQVAPTPAASK